MDFHMEFWLFCLCCINVLFKVISNLKFYKRCLAKMTFRSILVSEDDVLCAKEIHRLDPMDLKIYSRQKNHDCDSTGETSLLTKLQL